MLLVDVCSFRLDFEQFTTNGPADTSETGGGACQDTLTTTVVSYTVVPGFSVLGFRALPGFRALKAGDRAWLVHKTLFGFKGKGNAI